MKLLHLLLWVGQFGFSVAFPTVILLAGAVWLRERLNLGVWVVLVGGLLGLLTSFAAARSCIRAMTKDMGKDASQAPPPPAFNDHL